MRLEGWSMRGYIVLFVIMMNQLALSCEELGSHSRVASHQSTLPYNSYVKDPEEIKAYYKITLDGCTDDEATYLSAKGITQIGVIATLIEECWKQYQENGKNEVVKRSGITGMREIDGTIVKEVPFHIWYGFKNKCEARRYEGNRKRERE